MKNSLIALLFASTSYFCLSQNSKSDSLEIIINSGVSDIRRLGALAELCAIQINSSKPEESIPNFFKMRKLAAETKSTEKETTALLYLSESYRRKESFEKAKSYASSALELNKNNSKQYLLGINQLGRVYHHFQKYDLAIKTYQKGIDHGKKNSNEKTISRLFINMGISYDRLGLDDKEMQCYLNGLKWADSLEDYEGQNFATYTIACEYCDLKEYKKAEKYYLEGLSNAKKNKIHPYTSMNYHGMGILYSRWEKFDLSLKYNQLALEEFRKVGNELYEFDVLNNMAVLYYRMDSLNKSIDYGEQALELAEKLNHKLAISGAKMTLAVTYLELERLSEAEFYFLQVIPDTNNPLVLRVDSKMTLFENMSSLREKQGKYREALSYYKRMKVLADSITQKERFDHVTELEQKYQSERKEKELVQKNSKILKQRLKLEQEELKNTRSKGVIGLTVSIILLLGYLFYRRGRLIKQERKRYEIQVRKVSNLKRELELKSADLGKDFSTRLNEFHDFLKSKYNLTPATFEFWLLQVKGASEEEMQTLLFKSEGAIKSRRSSLYSLLKAKEDTDQTETFSRNRSVGIYYENLLMFFI